MSRTTSLSIRRLAVLASAVLAMAACQDESPILPAAPGAAESGPSAIKTPKPQFYFNGIVFTGTQDVASGELYAMNLDGTNVTRLTFDDSTDTRVDLSPNGKTMVWSRRAPGQLQGELFTANLDGSNRTRLTNFGTTIGYARYSPDGNKIAFMMRLASGAYEIFVMNANGTNVKQLTSMNRRASVPTWSPDGSKISFQADNVAGVESIWTMNADGSNQKLLLSCVNPGCVRPKWSPVANEIAFERIAYGGIFVIDASTALDVGYVANPDHDMDAAWTKDGKQIVFNSWRGNNNDGTADLFMTAPVRGPVTAPPPVIHLTSFVGNEVLAAVSK